MGKKLIKVNGATVTIYISYELQLISDWLSKHQSTEIFYIEQLFKQYKVGEMSVSNLIKRVNNDRKIVNDKMTINITTEVITKLAEFLNERDDNIIDNIKQILYQAYFQEAKRIINCVDCELDALNTLLAKADALNISSASLHENIKEYLTNNEPVFYNFVAKLSRCFDIKTNVYEVDLDEICLTESWYKNWFSDIEKNLISIIGD